MYPTRGAFAFRNYNPSKPNKYGMLFQSLNSVEWPFTHSVIVMAGKPVNQTGEFYIKETVEKVKKLVENQEREIKITGRNISTDRYYTGIQIADWLLNEKKVTLLGTLQKNRYVYILLQILCNN